MKKLINLTNIKKSIIVITAAVFCTACNSGSNATSTVGSSTNQSAGITNLATNQQQNSVQNSSNNSIINTQTPGTGYLSSIVLSGNTIYTGGQDGNVYVSQNPHEWSILGNTNPDGSGIRDINLFESKVYVATNKGGVLSCSIQACEQWEKVKYFESSVNSMVVTQNNMYIATNDKVFQLDSSKKWTMVGGSALQGTVKSLNYDNSTQTLYAITDTSQVFVSTPESSNWTPFGQSLNDETFAASTFVNNNLYVANQNGDVYYASANSPSWVQVGGNLPEQNLTSIYVNSQNQVYAATTAGNVWTAALNVKGGWSKVGQIANEKPITAITGSSGSSNQIFAATQGKINGYGFTSLNFYPWGLFAISGDNSIYENNSYLQLIKSTDQGNTWSPVSGAPSMVYNAAAYADNVYVMAKTGIFSSNNDGQSWSSNNQLSMPWAAAANKTTVYAATITPYTIYPVNVYSTSTESGVASWTSMGALPHGSANVIDHPLMAATDNNIVGYSGGFTSIYENGKWNTIDSQHYLTGLTIDNNSVYMAEYNSNNIYKYDLNSHTSTVFANTGCSNKQLYVANYLLYYTCGWYYNNTQSVGALGILPLSILGGWYLR